MSSTEGSTPQQMIWERVPLFPASATVTVRELAGMPDVEFARLLRANLIPSQPRAAWDRLWRALIIDETLRDRTYDLLDLWQDVTEHALAMGFHDRAKAEQARSFLNRCEEARNRLNREEEDLPLVWAGRAGSFQPNARHVIERLVLAISAHREAVAEAGDEADERLWSVLRAVRLDPRDYLGAPRS